MGKAQIFSLDIVIGFTVVVFVIAASSLLWVYSYERNALYDKQSIIHETVRDVSSSLVVNTGHPANWSDVNSASAIGIASEPWILDGRKIDHLIAADYNDSKNALGLGETTGFSIVVGSWNGTGFGQKYSVGLNSTNATVVAVQQRFALLNGSWARVTVKLWG